MQVMSGTEQEQPLSPLVTTIDGLLPEGKRLIHPLVVLIEDDDGEFLVTELNFYMHAVGTTIPEAIAEFKRILSDELDVLTTDEDKLGPRLRAQLHYLRKMIKVASVE